MPINMTTEKSERVSLMTNEPSGGMKKYHTMRVEKAVAQSPPRNAPSHELKKTAGKNRNHTSGCSHDQHRHCKPSASNGSNTADHGGSQRK